MPLAGLDHACPSDDPFMLSLLAQGSRYGLRTNLSPDGPDKSTIRAEEGRCSNPKRGLRWRMPDGTLEPVRCGVGSRCDYCATFAAQETANMLLLDARERCPTVGLTTTTRDPAFGPADLRKAEQALWRQLRREAERRGDPKPEYVGFLEWTTGEGTRSGGHRRPHVHHLVKGIPADDPRLRVEVADDGSETNELERHVSELWRHYTGDAFIVDCRPLRTPAGAINYLALHHRKRSQAPPLGYTGRRLRPSKGYWEACWKEEPGKLRKLAGRLAADHRIAKLVGRAISTELHGRDELDVDAQLTQAIADGLQDVAERPLELQVDLAGDVDHDAEHADYEARVVAALRRIRDEEPPELVRVLERNRIDYETGVAVREAVAVLKVIPLEREAVRAAA